MVRPATTDNRYSPVTRSRIDPAARTVIRMSESELRDRWRRDAQLLGDLGRALEQVRLPTVAVRLPAELAERAAAAWDREDGGGELGPEDAAARLQRHRAGSLALIGAAVREHGRRDGGDVVVELGAELVAHAQDAADDLPG